MEKYLAIGVYVAIGAVFIVLALGVANLVRTDGQARSRSNKLMRLRVLMQAIAIALLMGAVWWHNRPS